jgi:carboxylesterase type B
LIIYNINNLRIETDKGIIQGTLDSKYPGLKLYLGKNQNIQKKGIPYAEKPIQQNRFKIPQELQKWEGVLQTTSYKPCCVQPAPKSQPISEDW